MWFYSAASTPSVVFVVSVCYSAASTLRWCVCGVVWCVCVFIQQLALFGVCCVCVCVCVYSAASTLRCVWFFQMSLKGL